MSTRAQSVFDFTASSSTIAVLPATRGFDAASRSLGDATTALSIRKPVGALRGDVRTANDLSVFLQSRIAHQQFLIVPNFNLTT
ncbi:hypothetical protein F4777DRAFT_581162 [Nemania sp. FL0916]|nr:hypothetical protein F4777DRAFT_581162 [Nemania sp. FL0916]